MKKMLLALGFLSSTFLVDSSAWAASYIINNNTLIGINGLSINSVLYNVTFGDGTAERGFWPDNLLPFSSQVDAYAAAQSLIDFFNTNALFTTDIPNGINGVPLLSPNVGSTFFIPYHIQSQTIDYTIFDADYLFYGQSSNLPYTATGPLNGSVFSPGVSGETGNRITFANFTQEFTSVNEPPVFLLLAIGIVSFYVNTVRRSRV